VPSDLNPAVPKPLDHAFRRSYARLDKRFASAEEFLGALPPPVPSSLIPPKPPPIRPQDDRPPVGYDAFARERSMVRVSALASELGVDGRAILEKFRAEGYQVTTDAVVGTITFEQAQQAREWVRHGHLRRSSGGATALGSRSNCPQCRQSIDPADQYCMHCGVQLVENVRRCPQCGAYPDGTDQFCIFCGQSLVVGQPAKV